MVRKPDIIPAVMSDRGPILVDYSHVWSLAYQGVVVLQAHRDISHICVLSLLLYHQVTVSSLIVVHKYQVRQGFAAAQVGSIPAVSADDVWVIPALVVGGNDALASNYTTSGWAY